MSEENRVTIPKGTDERPVIPAGQYQGKVTRAEVRSLPGDNEKNESFINLAVFIQPDEGDALFVETNPFRNHTRLTPGSGSNANRFLRQLTGLDPTETEIALDQLIGMEVIVEVGYREYRYQGEDRKTNWIKNILAKE